MSKTCNQLAVRQDIVQSWADIIFADDNPVDRAAVQQAAAKAAPSLLPHGEQRFHVGYVLESGAQLPDWALRGIWDDGEKTYVLLPEVSLFAEAPMIRLLGPNGPQLVNARQYANVIIVDQLIRAAELRLGTGPQAEVVTIRRGQLRTIQCPGDAQCPVWPSEVEGVYGSSHVH
jgi:type IV secretory pathway VirB9-like protein